MAMWQLIAVAIVWLVRDDASKATSVLDTWEYGVLYFNVAWGCAWGYITNIGAKYCNERDARHAATKRSTNEKEQQQQQHHDEHEEHEEDGHEHEEQHDPNASVPPSDPAHTTRDLVRLQELSAPAEVDPASLPTMQAMSPLIYVPCSFALGMWRTRLPNTVIRYYY